MTETLVSEEDRGMQPARANTGTPEPEQDALVTGLRDG